MIELNGKNKNKDYIEIKEEFKPNHSHTYKDISKLKKYKVKFLLKQSTCGDCCLDTFCSCFKRVDTIQKVSV